MGAHKKTGSHYFSLNVDFFSDKKIKRLRASYGSDGVLIYIYLLSEIYRAGYYIEYDDDLILDVSAELNISVNLTRQIMNFLLSRSLFDNTLAKSDKILTAQSIQFRYQDMVKDRALKNPVWVEKRLWLISKEETKSFIKVYPSDDNSENYQSNSENYPNNSEKNAPSKVSNKSNVSNVSVSSNTPPSAAHTNTYGKQVRLTEKEYEDLTDKYGKSVIDKYIGKIDRYLESSGKKPYSNHYDTLIEWLAKDNVKSKSDSSFDLNVIFEYAKNNTPEV